jgi:hypothetical protein
VIAVAWGTVPDWLVVVGTAVIVWELWHDPGKPHFGPLEDRKEEDSG